MAGVARVFVKVVPDTDGFKETVTAYLQKLERTLQLVVKLDADTDQATRDLDKASKGRTATVNADADTGKASLKLAAISRSRKVNLDVNVSNLSLAKAQTQLLALTGLRPVVESLNSVAGAFQNIDRAVPKLAAVSLAVGSLGSVALSSSAGLLTLAGSLVPLVALAAPLPGLFAAAGVAGVTMAVALKATSVQLESLSPLWTKLQNVIENNFWDKAKKPIIDLVKSVFPQLKSGLKDVSSSLGTWSASVAGSFQKAFGGDVLTGMMAKLSDAIKASTKGTDSFAQSIATLGTFGSQYLPAIGGWFSDISVQFNGWLQTVASDGTLKGWVTSAMGVLGQLGSVIKSTVSILGGLFTAASAAGSGGLATLAGALQSIADVVNGPAFQSSLAIIFEGAATGAAALGTALGPIGAMFSALAPAIAGALAILGGTAAQLFSGIAEALSQPVVSAGLTDAILGISAGIQGLVPALGPLGQALGPVMTLIGSLAATLGPVLGQALTALAPVVTAIATAFTPLIPIIGQLASDLITALVPILTPLLTLFASLVPIISPLVQLLGAILIPIITALSPIIGQLAAIFTQVASAVAPIIQEILPPLAALFAALMPIISSLTSAFLPLLTPILALITPLLALIGPILTPLINLLTLVANVVGSVLTPVMNALTPVFAGVAAMIGDVLVPIMKEIQGVMQGVIDFLTGVFTGNWSKAWSGIVEIFSALWEGLGDTAKGALNGLIDLINGMIGGVNDITGAIGIPKIPKIPHLATGGDIEASPGGTLIVAGEGGQAETVSNRGLTNRMLATTTQLAQKALTDGTDGAGVTQNIYPQPGMSEETIGNVSANQLNFLLRGV